MCIGVNIFHRCLRLELWILSWSTHCTIPTPLLHIIIMTWPVEPLLHFCQCFLHSQVTPNTPSCRSVSISLRSACGITGCMQCLLHLNLYTVGKEHHHRLQVDPRVVENDVKQSLNLPFPWCLVCVLSLYLLACSSAIWDSESCAFRRPAMGWGTCSWSLVAGIVSAVMASFVLPHCWQGILDIASALVCFLSSSMNYVEV